MWAHRFLGQIQAAQRYPKALVKCFWTTSITPDSDGGWRQSRYDVFKSPRNHKANADLFKVYELQRKEEIHACMLLKVGVSMSRIRMTVLMKSACVLVIWISLSLSCVRGTATMESSACLHRGVHTFLIFFKGGALFRRAAVRFQQLETRN